MAELFLELLELVLGVICCVFLATFAWLLSVGMLTLIKMVLS